MQQVVKKTIQQGKKQTADKQTAEKQTAEKKATKKQPKKPVEATNEVSDADKKVVNSNGIHISRARCEWYMRNLISDDAIESQIKELKEGLKALSAEDEIKAKKNEINELNKKLFRISHYAPTAVSVICDTLVKDLIRFGMNQVIQSGKKTLDILHFQLDEIKSLRYYALISNSSILSNIEQLKLKKVEGEDVVAEPNDTMTFNTYIVNAINEIKKERDSDTKIIVGTRVKKFLSDLVIELIKRIMVITKSLLKSIVNVRTIIPEHIKAIVNIILVDGNALSNNIDDLMKLVDLKMEEAKVSQKNDTEKPQVEAPAV